MFGEYGDNATTTPYIACTHPGPPWARCAFRPDPDPEPSVQQNTDSPRRAALERDDGFHFEEYAHQPHAFWYTEWWYFNVIDPQSGIAGEVTFAVFNPGNELGMGTASLNAVFVEPGRPAVTKMDYHRISAFHGERDRADVTLAGNSITVVDADTYRIRARSDDGRFEADLTYRQADAPQFLVDRQPGVGWELTSWLVYMPRAVVDGTLRVNGVEHRMTAAVGYHDHDWGRWEVWKRDWSWADVADAATDFGFVLAEKGAFTSSIAYVRHGDLRLQLPDDRCTFRQSAWERWSLLWAYPRRLSFNGTDASDMYRLELTWTVEGTAVLWHYPLIVFEQTAKFDGALYERAGGRPDGPWQVRTKIDTRGLCEATSRWQRPDLRVNG
jgi:hypothetical protein